MIINYWDALYLWTCIIMHYIKACFIWVEATTRRINYVTKWMGILVSILVHFLVSFSILFGVVRRGILRFIQAR